MKISEKQLMMLLDIAKGSLDTKNPIGGYTFQVRIKLVNDIMNQLSNELKDVEPVDYKEQLDKALHLVPVDDVGKNKSVLNG